MRKGSEMTIDAPADAGPVSRSGFVDLDKLKNADNIVAIISQRRSTGVLTFGIFKEFERDGRIERTGFVTEELAESYQAMVKLAIERIAQLRKELPRRDPR